MLSKAIFKGQLDFGTQRSYEQVLKMYRWRVENYYKTDILINEEEIFSEELLRLTIKKFSAPSTKKSWRNTYMLLDYVAQFAVSGNVGMWMSEEGKIIKEAFIEPNGDRAAVLLYKKGCEAIKEGQYEDAIESLDKSLEKYPKHSTAFEARGIAYEHLKNYDKAIENYTESIKVFEQNAPPHMRLAEIALEQEDYEAAIAYLGKVIKYAIPHEPHYWVARYKKGEIHTALEEHDKAAVEYRFFSLRSFKPDNPNYSTRRMSHVKWGQALIKSNKGPEALKVFDLVYKMRNLKDVTDDLTLPEIHFWRGKARHMVGKKGYCEDWKKAKKGGIEEAKTLLKEFC